jgi:hypothetical protein
MPERPFLIDPIRFGTGGIDLRSAVDVISEHRFARLKNVRRTLHGAFTARPGQTAINTTPVGTVIHSIARLEDPANSTYARILGVDASIYLGTLGFTQVDTGYSGDPLSLVPYRPPLSSEAWMLVGDRVRNRKIRRDGLDLPLGVAPPAAACSVSLLAEQRTTIEDFESGFTILNGPNATAAVTYPAGKSNNCLQLTVTPTAGVGSAAACKAFGANLSQVGTLAADDDDLLHLWIRASAPANVEDIFLYLICSNNFSTAHFPGQHADYNTDGYYKVFRADEWATVFSAPDATTTDYATGVAVRRRRRDEERLADGTYPDEHEGARSGRERRAASREVAKVIPPGAGEWIEYGVIGFPLRRGDFRRFGSTAGRDWSTITGIILVVRTKNANAVAVSFDQLFMTGGYALDSAEANATAYDWRFTQYDTRTGDEGNPSPIMATTLDCARRGVTVTVAAKGDANFRQRIYRRGGTLVEGWAFVGANSADGAAFVDAVSDVDAQQAGFLELDNDEPCTTTTPSGTAVYGQPLRCLFGPVGGGYILGLGDPFRKGNVYWSKCGQPASWPAANTLEVCPPSEDLLAGCVYNGQPFIFSRDHLYAGYLNQSSGETFSFQVTPCGHGIAGRLACCVGPEIYFLSRDGIYATSGGSERNLTDDDLGPLFHRTMGLRDVLPSATLGGYGEGGYGEGGYGSLSNRGLAFPTEIDWLAESKLRLEMFENELYFTYQDTTGRIQTLVYNLLYQEWYWDLYWQPPRAIYTERFGRDSRLLMGSEDGILYERTGFNDAGVSIDCLIRTGARSQGAPRAEKTYGDLLIDADAQGAVLSVRTYAGYDVVFHHGSQILDTGRTQTIHDHFAGGVLSKAITLELVWASSDVRPVIYGANLAYLIEPERIEQRASDWNDLGQVGPKLVRGVVLQADTGGLDKVIALEGDGQQHALVTINTPARREVVCTITPFQASLLRVHPQAALPFLKWDVQWIYEPYPLRVTHWESRSHDHGLFGYHTHFDGFVTLLSTTVVTFTISVDGVNYTYTIPPTGGAIRKCYIPFRAAKGLLTIYSLDASSEFQMFADETILRVYPWGKGQAIFVKPFLPSTPVER